MLSAALFQLDQTNVKTADTRHLGFWTQSGRCARAAWSCRRRPSWRAA